MLISWLDARSRLNTWKADKTSLEVQVSRLGMILVLWGAIRELEDTVVDIGSDAGSLRMELREAFFDWDDEPPATSHFSAGMCAEWPNGDKMLFSVLRTIK
jgi:hypothetical protein